MNLIFKCITVMIILILISVRMLILPVEAMTEPHDPIAQLIQHAQQDARRDAWHDAGLRWFAYGAGCWMFAIVYASVNNPTVPSHRLLGKSSTYVHTYTNEYKRSIKNQRIERSAIGWGVSLGAVLWLWKILTD
ncbi:MAG: hypothetical protein OXI61_07680 [Candidatus Poribacteria bacterium]|nr:hypothetical protein [Candidatus Poribacteria bacterium]